MAHFYADIQGSRGVASRCGTSGSGIWGHIRGWNVGASVHIAHINGHDVVQVNRTRGSNGGGSTMIARFSDAPEPDPPPPAKPTQLKLPFGTPDDPLNPEKYTYDQLVQLVHLMRQDWETLNKVHNERARREDWCGTYENNQALYNESLKVLKLQPRDTRRAGSSVHAYIDRFGDANPI